MTIKEKPLIDAAGRSVPINITGNPFFSGMLAILAITIFCIVAMGFWAFGHAPPNAVELYDAVRSASLLGIVVGAVLLVFVCMSMALQGNGEERGVALGFFFGGMTTVIILLVVDTFTVDLIRDALSNVRLYG